MIWNQLPAFKGHLVCLIITTSYIISLYLIPKKVRDSQRDNPTHIRYRIMAASLSTIISGLVLSVSFKSWNFPTGFTFLQACGMRLDTASVSISTTCLLMSIFYLGPLVSSSVYLYVSYFYGVDDYGNIGEKKGKSRNANVISYLWNICMRCVHNSNTDSDLILLPYNFFQKLHSFLIHSLNLLIFIISRILFDC